MHPSSTMLFICCLLMLLWASSSRAPFRIRRFSAYVSTVLGYLVYHNSLKGSYPVSNTPKTDSRFTSNVGAFTPRRAVCSHCSLKIWKPASEWVYINSSPIWLDCSINWGFWLEEKIFFSFYSSETHVAWRFWLEDNVWIVVLGPGRSWKLRTEL